MALPSSEFTAWAAYYSLEPDESTKADIRLGLLRATVYNASPRTWKDKIKVRDLVPTWEPKKAEPAGKSPIWAMAESLRKGVIPKVH